MPEFFNVLPPDDARKLLFKHIVVDPSPEIAPTFDSYGRITAKAILAPQALPSFRRSTMDGYAVHAAATYGASETLPAVLTVTGEIAMGKRTRLELSKYSAAIVHTGGMLPDSSDAVVQVEHTQPVEQGQSDKFPYDIEVFRPVATGQNILQIGEDVQKGSQVLPSGHRIRSQDIGGLLALGILEIPVSRQPRVAIISTGDEVINPDENPKPGQIRDINSYTIASLAKQAGGIPVLKGIVQDDLDSLLDVARAALADNDMIVLSAGSSVSYRDMTGKVMAELGQPGVLLHGVATKPGKPTIIGVAHGKPLLGLPGNPVSAMVQFAMFGVPSIYKLQGLTQPPRWGLVQAKVSSNIASETGREDYVPAKLEEKNDGLVAHPVFGKSNLIYTLVNADGLIKVPLNSGGIEAGAWVEVQLF